jgi:predicted aminopeptidase
MKVLTTKRALLLMLIGIAGLVVWNYKLLSYGISQGYGQLQIVWKAQPIEEVLQDKSFPDSLKQKLQLVKEIRHYAIDSLGLKESKNYTNLYDQQGKPLMWVVTGCMPYAFEAKEWRFPFVGTVSYKGFFNKAKAEEERQQVQQAGYETEMGTVSGWSTLGWFKDPILSNMLYRSPGALAELIIHELTHATIYINDSTSLNENIANFVGVEGAKCFLRQRYGSNAPEYVNYINTNTDEDLYSRYLLKHTRTLDSIYHNFTQNTSTKAKDQQKQAVFQAIIAGIDSLPFHSSARYYKRIHTARLNNAYLMDYLRYESKKSSYEQQFDERYHHYLPAFIATLKKQYQ